MPEPLSSEPERAPHGPEPRPGSGGPSTLESGPGGAAATASADLLDSLVAEALEATPDEREALLARLGDEDAIRAARVRSRLAALGELGMCLDGAPRSTDLPLRFGDFLRLERVGGGGMGEVYRARDERSGDWAALKLVRPDQLWFEAARVRFRREIQATALLAHPDIVRVLEVGEERGVPWLAMEWVGGVSLEEVLERLRGRPPEALGAHDLERAVRDASAERASAEPPREGAFPGGSHEEVVARVVLRMARALAHAHAAGVLHRDVKPSNILVTPAGRVLLADFGLALPRGADRMTRTGTWLGSLPYAAPEQIEGSPRNLDPRADLYSLGATLYELVTLRTPFLGGPEGAVRRRITTGDLEAPRRLNPALSRDLERLTLAALDPDPRRRPPSAQALAEELERFLAGAPVRVLRKPPWLRARRWMVRHPRLALATAAGLLVVLASLGVALRERALASRLTRLGDAELVRALQEEARDFWPAAQTAVGAMDAWLRRADEVLARRADHQRAFEALTRRALPYEAADRSRDQAGALEDLTTLAREIDALSAFVTRGGRSAPPPPVAPEEVRARDARWAARLSEPAETLVASLRARVGELRSTLGREPLLWRSDMQQLDDFERLLDASAEKLERRRTFRFESSLDAWQYEALRRLLEDQERLAALVSQVEIQRASTVALVRQAEGAGSAAWERARAAIAASPRYGGLVLEPIFGLRPLGENPESHLWEFLFLPSGQAPERDPERPGRWCMREESGLVLVLVPGGRFVMGQRPDELPPLPSALPMHEVELAPFLVSRFELSVAQAERLGGLPTEKTRPADGRLPLVLDWERASALLARHGLALPTEAQWEYAARAEEVEHTPLRLRANVLDRSRLAALRDERLQQEGTPAEFDDGFPDLAPIGSLLPNAFGLQDVLGNVSEWCLDHYVMRGYSTLWPRAGDGLRATVVSAQLRAARGGSFQNGPAACQLGGRLNDVPGKMPDSIGVRPVRALDLH